MSTDETFGEALRRARERIGWERKQVEEQAALPADTLAWWEEGRSVPNLDEWGRLRDLLDLDQATWMDLSIKRIEWIEARKPPEQRGRPPHLEPGRSPTRPDPKRR